MKQRFPDGSVVKNPPVKQDIWVQSLSWEDPQGQEMANHSNILSWEISCTEDPGGHGPCSCKELDTTEQLSMHANETEQKSGGINENKSKFLGKKSVKLTQAKQTLYTSYLGYKICKYHTSPKTFTCSWFRESSRINHLFLIIISLYIFFFSNLKKYFDSWNQNLYLNHLVKFKVNEYFTEIKIISKLAFQLNTNCETRVGCFKRTASKHVYYQG